jgi:hypothetical protein
VADRRLRAGRIGVDVAELLAGGRHRRCERMVSRRP